MLKLSVAVGPYDRVRPLIDGEVRIDAVEAKFMMLEAEEIFFRAFRHADFDVCELLLSSDCVKTAQGTSPDLAIPMFPSRSFRRTSIYVRTDRVRAPGDLRRRGVGLDANRRVLDAFLARHHAEGLSERRLSPDKLFHPASLETHKI